ncbi:MAG: ABC transporter permease subunit [Eubacteriales bacterium]|nr:ABC transporter permease subunit [Eubacteriales bacterium]
MSEHTLSPHAGASLKKWFGRLHKNRQLYVLILPAIISVFIFHYIPIYGVQVAFKDFRASMEIWGSPWVGLKHFARFFEMPFFGMMIRNTLSISLYSLATFPCAVIVALLLNELRNERFKKVVQMVSYAPHFVSTVVVCSMVLIFFDKNRGLANNVLALLGRERISFIETPKYFSSLYVWSGVWSSVGWNTIIYLAALSSISPEMIEAARIDGASQWKILWHINVPSILPTIVTLLILNTGSILSVGFEKIYLLQNPLNLDASRVISTYVYEVGMGSGQFSYSTAIGLFNNVVNVVCIVLVNQISRTVTHISMW